MVPRAGGMTLLESQILDSVRQAHVGLAIGVPCTIAQLQSVHGCASFLAVLGGGAPGAAFITGFATPCVGAGLDRLKPARKPKGNPDKSNNRCG